MKKVEERFLEYIKFNTKANENSSSYPSSENQLILGKALVQELTEIGLSNVSMNEYGYVMAEIKSNCDGNIPTVAFISHMDTSPDASGENIKPNIISNYDGNDINLSTITISPSEFPELKNYIGDTLITSDGTTLLGADDKAGIAEIITATEYIVSHPEIKHGTIKIGFTPDEELGKGVDYFDVKSFGADFAYTIDGGKLGELEYENFNAAHANIVITGKSVHPGTAKNIMKNAALIGTELASMFPQSETPSTTEGYEGFYHLTGFNANVGTARLSYIIRDFDKQKFEERKKFVKSLVQKINDKYNNIAEIEMYDEYYNMATIINDNMNIVELAKKSIIECDVVPIIKPIRGGTDGARLSFMGLPCPNIFTGGHNFHGPYEFIPVASMEAAVQVIVKIVKNIAAK